MLTSTNQYRPLAQGIPPWGGVSLRKVPQGSAPFQLETFPQRPCLVLMRAACPEGGLLSPSATFLRVFTTAEGRFCSSLPLPLHLLGGGSGLRARPPVEFAARVGTRAPGVLRPTPFHRHYQRCLRPRLTPACGPRLPPPHRPERCGRCPRRRSPIRCRTRISARGCSTGECPTGLRHPAASGPVPDAAELSGSRVRVTERFPMAACSGGVSPRRPRGSLSAPSGWDGRNG